ncbi:MAG: hypothetical protein H8D23_15895 [Candidatus Brocadiales bacterium]|nr:hypothetical protein [Candidatus Brocadiales bacterium]
MQIKIKELTITDIFELSQIIKKKCRERSNLEEIAQELMNILYQTFITDSGKSALVLSRFFKSNAYEYLPDDIKTYIHNQECKDEIPVQNRYLTLLGTTGDLDEWNYRKASNGHQALPLYDPHIVSNIPMLSALLNQIGFDIFDLTQPDNNIIINKEEHKFGVFCVEDAKGNRLIPKQAEFVEPFGIKSVIGFGGRYKTGQIYAIIMFCRERISRETAKLFISLNPTVKFITLRQEMTGNIFKLEDKL